MCMHNIQLNMNIHCMFNLIYANCQGSIDHNSAIQINIKLFGSINICTVSNVCPKTKQVFLKPRTKLNIKCRAPNSNFITSIIKF